MSVRLARWWLFALALLALPFPLLVIGEELAPPLRTLQMAGWGSAVWLQEGASVTVRMILGVFWVHALGGVAASWLLAWAASRLLARASLRVRTIVVLALTAVALTVALSGPVYRTELGPEPRADLVGALS